MESSRPPLSISVFKKVFWSIVAPKNGKKRPTLQFLGFCDPIPFWFQKGTKNEFVDAKFLRAENMDLKLSKSGLRMSVGALVQFVYYFEVW